jgi:hypothetical protein
MSILLITSTEQKSSTLQVQLKMSISINILSLCNNTTLRAKLKLFNHNMKVEDMKEEAWHKEYLSLLLEQRETKTVLLFIA